MSLVGKQWQQSFAQQEDAYAIPLDSYFLDRFLRSPYIQIPRAYANLRAGVRTLEAGCGSAKFSLSFARLGCHAVALDFSTHIIANVRELHRRAQTLWGPLPLTATHGDVETLAFANNSFDLTMNEGVVEHWLDTLERQKVLAEMVRVTKHGGTVCVIVPNGHHPFLPFWQRYMPAYRTTPPMTLYDTARLAQDLASVGLREIDTDGIYAWRSLDQYPTFRPLRWTGGLLQRLIPLPRSVRARWGVNLIAMGRKT